jgi:hypothetical protein
MTELVAIHQPNFFPWLGYFDKILRADAFVLLDNVQFPKTGGIWTNRVKVLINGEGRWITAPVDRRYHGTRQINQMFFSNKENWRSKLLKTLVAAYHRTPYFEEAFAILNPLVCNPEENVAQYNFDSILSIAHQLGIPKERFYRASQIGVDESATEMLVSLTRSVGGTTYLCGGGSMGYQDDSVFSTAGVSLIYQNFQHPIYQQRGSQKFVPGLSIIDALMNIGKDKVYCLLASNKE